MGEYDRDGYHPAAIAAVVVILVIVVGLVLGLIGAATSFRKTPADKIAVSYGAGPFEGNQFQRVVQPGSGLVNNGMFDKWYEYPTTKRNYIVSHRANEGDVAGTDTIAATTQDRVQVEHQVAVYFTLNRNLIRQFHESIGLKYKAWTEEGWNKMLLDNFRKPLDTALQNPTRQVTVNQLYSDPNVLDDIERAIATDLKNQVNRLLGGDYFCGPTYDGHGKCTDFQVILNRPLFPAEVVKAFEDQQTSAARVTVAQNEANQRVARAEGAERERNALAAAASDPNYIAYLDVQARTKCAENPNCTLVIVPQGGGTNVNVGGR